MVEKLEFTVGKDEDPTLYLPLDTSKVLSKSDLYIDLIFIISNSKTLYFNYVSTTFRFTKEK